MSKKQTPLPTRPQLVHEHNTVLRQHRLVIVTSGRPDASPWTDESTIGFYKGYNFSTQERAGLPAGVFTVTKKVYEVLS